MTGAGRPDPTKLVELRLRSGLSQRALAAAAGTGAGVIARLEAGGSDRQLTLHRLRAISESLGGEVVDLLSTNDDRPPEPAADDVKLEALLAHSGRHLRTDELATVLAWDLLRTGRALRALRRRLNAGVTLRRTAAGWRLAAHESILSDLERQRLADAEIVRRGLTVRQYRLLDRLRRGEKIDNAWERRATNADRVDLAVLLRARIAERSESGRIQLTPATLYSLEVTMHDPSATDDEQP